MSEPEFTEQEVRLIQATMREQIIVEAAEHGIACFERLLQIKAAKWQS